MRVTFLGSGTSHGVPVIGCDCVVCRSSDPRNQRLRPSVWIQTDTTSLLIDATPDFRQQALRARIPRLDAVLLTHTHADHFLGLDDLRAYTTKQAQKLPIFGSPQAIADVRRVFDYAIAEKPAYPTLPNFGLQELPPGQELSIGDVRLRAVELPHGWGTVLGFVFRNVFAYLTDCNAVAPEVIESIRGVRVLALDALRPRPHPTHLTLAQARQVAEEVGAGLTLYTHMSHETEHATTEAGLPANIRLAYDGMQLEIDETSVTKLA
jgi:phosphoribosyl 1,2-cyclic phosphate phosphodiesterase